MSSEKKKLSVIVDDASSSIPDDDSLVRTSRHHARLHAHPKIPLTNALAKPRFRLSDDVSSAAATRT